MVNSLRLAGALASISLLVNCTPIPGAKTNVLEQFNTSHLISFSTRSTSGDSSGSSISVLDKESLKTHWENQRGGHFTDPKVYINPSDRVGKFLSNAQNQEIPLVSLDCENSVPSEGYGGNYHGVCLNYLWWRTCDPSTKTRSKNFGGYVEFKRGDSYSNGLRRKLGGYKGTGGPCNRATKPEIANTYITGLGMSSMEEFPMAFMEEGGRFEPANQLIGKTPLKDGVDRSPCFRCIDQSENVSAGSKIAGMVRKRNVLQTHEQLDAKKSKTAKIKDKGKKLLNSLTGKGKGTAPASGIVGPSSTSTSQQPVSDSETSYSTFFFDVYNYGPVSATVDWAEWESKCENDGGQFLGLTDYEESPDKSSKKGKAASRPPVTPPKGSSSKGKQQVPSTPANQIMTEQPGEPPNAPIKAALSDTVRQYYTNLAKEELSWTRPRVDPWTTYDQMDPEKWYESLFPDPPSNGLALVNSILSKQKYEYFLFADSNAGVKDDKDGNLARYIKSTEAMVQDMADLKIGDPKNTPTKPGQGGAVGSRPVTPVKNSGKNPPGSPPGGNSPKA